MAGPVNVRYAGVAILVHEAGCECDRKHAPSDFGADGRAAILTTYDDDAEKGYYQVWYRTGRWGLRDAIEALLDRSKNRDRMA